MPSRPALDVVAPLLNLDGRLAIDQCRAAERDGGVPGAGALDAVPLPRLLPQDEDRDAGEDAAGGELYFNDVCTAGSVGSTGALREARTMLPESSSRP